MITRKTVFVLGAGCSMPYAFPSGEQLVNEIIDLAQAHAMPDTFQYAGFTNEQVKRFGRDLADSDAPSIDTFLEHRREFLQIGKLAIAIRMSIRETDDTLARAYRQPGQNHRFEQAWYHYLWNLIAASKGQFGDNKLAFVTFNYDRSLERYLFLRLRALHGSSESEVFEDLYRLRFVHIHGSLGDASFSEIPYQNKVLSHDVLIKIASRLRIIHEDPEGNPNFSDAIDLLQKAECICFLGYGFHDLNNKGLHLQQLAEQQRYSTEWYSSRFHMTEVEFLRKCRGFSEKFSSRVGGETDGALEVLRKLPIIG